MTSQIFFRKVADSIEEIGNDTCVICGDFNVVQDQDLDTFNYLHVNNPKSKECILTIKEELNLIDPYRELNESEKKFTWRRPHPLKQARLDYFLISENFMPSVQSHNILPSYRSDHSTVILSFQINDFKRGSGLWKFNNSLLRDREYINIVKDCIQQVKEQYMLPIYDLEYIIENEQNLEFQISDQLFLETLLMEIRGKTISYSSFKKKQNNLKEHNVEEEIKHLENIEPIDLEKINEKKLELENFRKEKIQGIMVRAKIKWAEEGEKPTRYFCSLESRNYVNKTIPKVQQENGNTIKTQEEILKEVQKFYSNLYAPQNSEKDINDQDILKNLQHPVLTNIESSNLEGEITADEISNVLRNMKNNKSPGSDGFTVEFFKFFFKDFKHFIRRSINEGYQKGTFSVTQRQGIITCLPKGDKPRQFLKNWRPITLLNVIYKIASGCIAQRLKSVLPKLISSDQTGFLSGRYIGENTRLIYDLMNYVEEENIPGLLLVVDFEKAFESISWDFIGEVLEFFKFGPSMKKWISVLYNNISSAVTQCGFLSDFFNIGRGCRQGDPPSPYIFLLCAEVLSLMLKQNIEIKGIKIGNVEHILSQFADDTTIILDGSEKSLTAAIQTLDSFARLSNLKVNSSKTRAIWIGCKKFSGETFNHRLKLNWTQTNFDILGIKFSCNLDTMVKINFKDKIEQIDKELKVWSKRKLTPFGRITVLKTIVISKLNHLFIALPNPTEELINNLQKKFFHFIWQSGTDRIKRDTLMQEYDKGGLKMINLKNYMLALKSTWIRRLIVNTSKYVSIFETMYTKINDLINRGLEFTKRLIRNKSNIFWNDVLNSWIEICNKQNETKSEEIGSINIWNNKDITIANNSFFYRRWYEKNIYFIKDILNEDGTLMSFNQFINKYELQIDFMQYFSVRTAVLNYIRRKQIHIGPTQLTNNNMPFNFRIVLKSKKGCKDMYKVLNEKEIILKSQIKWNVVFGNEPLDWCQIYKIPAKSCSNTKLHWFQYRILHRILATNDLLLKCGIKQDNLCTFCQRVPEKIEHLFWYCNIVMEFWENIENWIYEKNQYLANIDKKRAIFGICNQNEFNKPINYILILTRFYIYKCRINNKELNIATWVKEMKFFLHIEKKIAIKTDRFDKFAKYWQKWMQIFDDN